MADFTGGGEAPESRVKGWEQMGLAFSILLLAAATVIGFVSVVGKP
ncbi:hypothetical protein [Pseudarthrobacter sp. fls2-241-R2A-127]|nr:hypothetical protein [Pseudarthrobacter sp. fls2-241-R2A-127]